VTATRDRIVILPRDVAARVLTAAFARGAWAVALVTLSASIPIVIDMFVSRGLGDRLLWPLACLLAMGVVVLVSGLRPSTLSRVVYLVAGGLLALGYTVAVLHAEPSFNSDAQYLVNRLNFVVVLIGVAGAGTVAGVAWITGAYVTTIVVMLVASMILGMPVEAGLGPTIGFVVSISTFLSITLEIRSRARSVPDLARLEAETRRLAVEDQFEQRAAAIVHDTVLGDLAAVMHSTGEVDEKMRARFRADVATLADPSWLSDSSSFEPSGPVDSELRIALTTLATEFQWRGLSVNTSGSYAGVVGISPEAATALVASIRACLENVVRHARCESADLVFDSSDGHLTAIVVDSGVGFDPRAVAVDRLGIRASIVGRIEQLGGTVKVWSSPGAGTSVVISLPSVVDKARTDEWHQ
jgi:signal transduction histidine kinase